MKDLSENNLIRFKNITKRKESIYVNFRVSGIRAGVTFSTNSLEQIVEECARIGVKEFKKAEFQFEGITQL
jgi:hypothetical protein